MRCPWTACKLCLTTAQYLGFDPAQGRDKVASDLGMLNTGESLPEKINLELKIFGCPEG